MNPTLNLSANRPSRMNAAPRPAQIARMVATVSLTVIFALVAGACNKAESEAPPAKGRPGRGAQAGRGGAQAGKGAQAEQAAQAAKAAQAAQREQLANILVTDKGGLRSRLAASATTEYKGGRVSTNQWGMRDKDYQLTPQPATRRIAVLGPAHVFGAGVNDGQTFEQLVEDRLNREVSPRSGLKFESLNFGVPNYTLMQQAIILSNGRVGEYRPDVVMIVSDLGVLRTITDYVWRELQAGRSFPAPIDQVVRKAAVTNDMPQADAFKKLLPYAEDLAELALKDASAEIRRMGAEPVYAVIPTPAKRNANSVKESQLLLSLAKAAGFLTLDLLNVYKGTTGAEVVKLALSATDRQPNAEGHRMIATGLYEALTRMPAVLAADTADGAKRKATVRAAWSRDHAARRKAAEAIAAKPATAAKPAPPPVPIEGWTVEAPDGGVAKLESSRRDNWMRITISRLPKTSGSTVKLRKAPVSITKGHRYVMSLWLKADANRPVGCRVAQAAAPGGLLGESTELQAVTWWEEFSCSFTATGTASDAQILLDLGTTDAALDVSKVQLKNLTTGEVVMSTDPAWRRSGRGSQ